MSKTLSVILSGLLLGGCSPPDVLKPAEASEALWGPVTFTNSGGSNCGPEQNFVLQAMAKGRAISRSATFETCIRTAMAGTISLNGDAHAGGRVQTSLGPYDFCAGDPTSASSPDAVVANARSGLGVQITCDSVSAGGAQAFAGITTTPGLNESLTYHEPKLSTSMASSDPYYVAGTIWHEAMHQHGYGHGSGTAEDCGYATGTFADDDQYWFMRHTIPYILTSCVTYIGDISDSCPTTCDATSFAVRTALDPNAACTCMHTQSFATQWFSLETGTPLAMTTSDAVSFIVAPNNKDLFVIQKQGTGSGRTEVHVLSAASNYQSFVLDVATPFPQTGSTVEYLVDRNRDLYQIQKQYTGSGHTEVHVLTAASNYQSFRLHVATPFPPTDSTVQYAIDSARNIFQIQKQFTGTHSTELHVLTAASNYTQFGLQTGTAFAESDQYTTFDIGLNGDLIAVQRHNTATGSTEVHVLSAASLYRTFIVETGTEFADAPTGSAFHVLDDGSVTRQLFGIQFQSTKTQRTEMHILNFNQ